MKIYSYEKDIEFPPANNHLGGALIDKSNGAKNGFCIGISYYTSSEYSTPGIHEDQEGFYVLEGSGTAKVGDEEFKVFPGGAFIATNGVPHTIKKDVNEKYIKILWSHGAV